MSAARKAAVAPGVAAAPGASAQAGGSVAQGEQRSCLTSQLRKTKICVYHLKGACQYGNSCAFAHSCLELQSVPDLRKTRLCLAFERGGCNDEDCSFAHGEDDLRSTNLFYKKTLCIWNQKGKCRNGNQCRFAHGTMELRTSQGGPGSAGASRAGAASKQAARDGGRKVERLTKEHTKGPVKAPARDPMQQPMKAPMISPMQEPMKEPMKVMPAGGFLTPTASPVSSCHLGSYTSSESSELCMAFPPPPPPPGLSFGSEGQDSSLQGEVFEDASWWQWSSGYGMEYGMEYDMLAPKLPGKPEVSVQETKIDLMRIRDDLMKKDLEKDLQRLRMGVEGLTQQFHAVQMQFQVSAPAESAKVASEFYRPGIYLKTASDLCFDPTQAGLAMADTDASVPAYWS